ncbi:hypothetical protein LINPERHAP1_LOCUS13688 [Linum perenne]
MRREGSLRWRGRVQWGYSYKKTTLIVCSLNIVIALYVLHSLYASLYLYSDNDFVHGVLVKALESDWAVLSENIGLWIPSELTNSEHDDRPDGQEEQEEEILPGPPLKPECHAELHTDYDGVAVKWGLTHPKDSAAECCQACLDHAKRAKPGSAKCNIWVYCPSENGCYSPDIYEHKNMECWLKYAENPKVNFKDRYSETYRNSHPNAPVVVPWVSGVVS